MFLASRRTGFYFAVLREGMVGAGDSVELIGREKQSVSVADITRLYAFERADLTTMRRAVKVAALPEGWKEYFQQRIDKGDHTD
jgi:MOSC domain-containing protein YiiM